MRVKTKLTQTLKINYENESLKNLLLFKLLLEFNSSLLYLFALFFCVVLVFLVVVNNLLKLVVNLDII